MKGRNKAKLLRDLDTRQRKALTLFVKQSKIQSKDLSKLLKLQPRTINDLCKKWVEQGFLEIADASKKARAYKLADPWSELLVL